MPEVWCIKCGRQQPKFGPVAQCWTLSTVGGARGQFEIQEPLHTLCMRDNVPSHCCVWAWQYLPYLTRACTHTHVNVCISSCMHKLSHCNTTSVFLCTMQTHTVPPLNLRMWVEQYSKIPFSHLLLISNLMAQAAIPSDELGKWTANLPIGISVSQPSPEVVSMPTSPPSRHKLMHQ